MEELISIMPVIFGEEKVDSVDSRTLYKELGLVKGQYSRWIKNYVNNYDFEENFDYITLDINVEGIKTKTYIISTDMAKEICMMSNTKTGSKIRKYFIRVEKLKCDTNKSQLEAAQKRIKELSVKRMKTYKGGLVSLRKFIKENDIPVTEETAWGRLEAKDIVESRDVPVSKKFLIDDSFGEQHKDEVIKFHPELLADVFSDFVEKPPSLFDIEYFKKG